MIRRAINLPGASSRGACVAAHTSLTLPFHHPARYGSRLHVTGELPSELRGDSHVMERLMRDIWTEARHLAGQECALTLEGVRWREVAPGAHEYDAQFVASAGMLHSGARWEAE